MAKNYGGYEGIYQWQLDELAGCDLGERASDLGLSPEPDGGLRLRFFGRDYLVSRQGVRPVDGGRVSVNHLSLIAHYAMSAGRGEPLGEFLPLRRLSGTVEGRGSYDHEAVSRPLEIKYGHNLPALRKAALRLEGREMGRDKSGGLAWIFYPFPKVPLKLVFHEPDEEFSAEFRLLFDRSAPFFMSFEALGFLAGAFVREICRDDQG